MYKYTTRQKKSDWYNRVSDWDGYVERELITESPCSTHSTLHFFPEKAYTRWALFTYAECCLLLAPITSPPPSTSTAKENESETRWRQKDFVRLLCFV